MSKSTKRIKKKRQQMDRKLKAVLDSTTVEKEDKQAISQLLLMDPKVKQWDGQRYTPPGSVLAEIVSRFEQYTEAPLEIAFAMTLQFLATILIRKGVTVCAAGNMIEVAIWLIVLAESGASKSLIQNHIKRSLEAALKMLADEIKPEDLFWDAPQTTAEFMYEWAGKEEKDHKGKVTNVQPSMNRRTLIVDEATDFFIGLKDPKGFLYGMYRNFLLAYSHEKITHNTRGGGKLEIPYPVIGFLGMATPGRFCKQVTEKDIEGGFFWRWAILRAGERRSMIGKAIFPSDMLSGIEKTWEILIKSIKHKTYIVSDMALEKFKTMFDDLAIKSERDNEFPGAYVRRISWTLHTLALLYHIILGRGAEQIICPEAYEWVERLLPEFNASVSLVLQQVFGSETVGTLQKVDRLIRSRAARGLPTTARDVVYSLRIPTKDARDFLQLVQMKDADAGPFPARPGE